LVPIVDDDADGEAEELVDLAHPLGVALGEVIVDGDDVDAVAGESVQIAGERGDEGFALTGTHFGDLALVEDHAADELDIEVAHVDDALAGLADEGEGLGEEFVEDVFFGGDDLVFVGEAIEACRDTVSEFLGLGAKFFVGKLLQFRLEGADGLDAREQALDGAVVAGAKDLGECFLDHVSLSLGCIGGRVCLRVVGRRNAVFSSLFDSGRERWVVGWCGRRNGGDLVRFFQIFDLGLVFSKNAVKITQVGLHAIHSCCEVELHPFDSCCEVRLDTFNLQVQFGLNFVDSRIQPIKAAVIEENAREDR
jgi:hypothetical protein